MNQKGSRSVLRVAAVLVVAAAAGIFTADAGRAAENRTPMFRKGEVIVEIKQGARIADVNARVGTTTIQRIDGTHLYRLATPKGKKEKKFRRKLAKDPDVVSAALNPVVASPISVFGRSTVGFPDGHPSTGQSRAQYESQIIFNDLGGVHTRSLGTDVVVAVIDTGVDRTHPDLVSHLWVNSNEIEGDGVDNDGNGFIDDLHGWDFLISTNDPSEAEGDPQTTVAGHGTFISGLIALLAPGAKIMPLRAFDANGVSDAFTVSQAIKYAADNNARVINLSFGSPDDSPLLHDAIKYAAERGAVLVASVGNDGHNTDVSPEFPANWNLQVVGVAAVDAADHKADFSNFGSTVSVAAPGVRLFSLYPQFGDAPPYARWSGTSFAAPLTVAEAALIIERDPHNTNIRAIVEETAQNIDDRNPGFSGLLGRGRIDPLQALRQFDQPGSRAEIQLYPTSVEPAARGTARIEISDVDQKFEVAANYLRPRDHYKLLVNGVLVADDNVTSSAVCSNFGGLKIEFSAQPDDDHLPIPAQLNPITLVQHVEIRDGQERVVLQGDFRPATGGSGGGPAGQSYEKETRLFPTGVAPQADGKAKVEVESNRETLEIEADGLLSGIAYQIVVDGIDLGSATAQSNYFKVEYTSDGSTGRIIPASLLPVSQIKHVEIRDANSQIVLQGDLQPGGDDIGGGDAGDEITFAGTIEALPAAGLIGDWLVDARIVHVSSSTEIKAEIGAPAPGVQVEVRGALQQDGSIVARRVETLSLAGGDAGGGDETRFTGVIELLPPVGLIGDWQVAGRIIRVSASTEVKQDKGLAAVGAQVEVRGVAQSDGSVAATKVEVTSAAPG